MLSIIALVISVRGCAQAERAVRLAQLEFAESRQTALQFQIDDRHVSFSPTGSEARLETVWFSLPGIPGRVSTHSDRLPLDHFIAASKAFIRERSLRPDTEYWASIPFGAEFAHITKGDTRVERQLYLLYFVAHPPHVKLDHITYLRRLADHDDMSAELDKLVSQSRVYLIREVPMPSNGSVPKRRPRG